MLDRLADRLPPWLVSTLRAELNAGRGGDTMTVLRYQLSHLSIEVAEGERADLEALALAVAQR